MYEVKSNVSNIGYTYTLKMNIKKLKDCHVSIELINFTSRYFIIELHRYLICCYIDMKIVT